MLAHQIMRLVPLSGLVRYKLVLFGDQQEMFDCMESCPIAHVISIESLRTNVAALASRHAVKNIGLAFSVNRTRV